MVCLEWTSGGAAKYQRAWRSTYWLAGLLKGGGTERKRKDLKGCWVVLILQIQHKFTTREVKVTGGRLRPLSCANRKMIVISEYQSNATNERVPAISDDRLYYLPTAAGWTAASFFCSFIWDAELLLATLSSRPLEYAIVHRCLFNIKPLNACWYFTWQRDWLIMILSATDVFKAVCQRNHVLRIVQFSTSDLILGIFLSFIASQLP